MRLRRRPITHTFEWATNLSSEDEAPIWVEYTYTPGCPPTGPSYASGEPGTAPTVEIVKAYRDDAHVVEIELSEADEARIIIEIEDNHEDEWGDF